MIVAETITRLRDKCPTFEDRVGGTFEFGRMLDSKEESEIELPYCFVMPLVKSEEANPDIANLESQMIEESFATIVCVDNTSRRVRGKYLRPDDMVELAFTEIYEALLGWEPKSYMTNIRFRRGLNLEVNESKIWFQFEWYTKYMICPEVVADTSALITNIFSTRLNTAGIGGGSQVDGDVPEEDYCPVVEDPKEL